MQTGLTIVLALVVMSACGGGGDEVRVEAPSCVAPTPAPDVGEVPKELRLGRHATITEVTTRKGALGVTAVSDLPVVELYPPLARAVLDAGYSIVSSDNEGFEAEIFFGDEDVTGAYRLREAPCGDQVVVKLLFDDEGDR